MSEKKYNPYLFKSYLEFVLDAKDNFELDIIKNEAKRHLIAEEFALLLRVIKLQASKINTITPKMVNHA